MQNGVLKYNSKTPFTTGHQSFANYTSIISYAEILSSIHEKTFNIILIKAKEHILFYSR